MQSAESIERQAARWVAIHDGREPTAEEARQFEAWIQGDPRRMGAYVRLEAVNARLRRARGLQGLQEPPPRPGRPVWWALAAAAAVVASAAPLGLGAWKNGHPDRRLHTALGEQYRTKLNDGSMVELNTDSRAEVRLRPRERNINLASGEAMFEVAKDAQRPFVVHTRLGDVRAVGTAFSVRLEDALDVAVTEGVVEVTRHGRAIARLAAGDRLALNPAGDVRVARGQEERIERDLAWREGKLAFAGETLGEAAAQFNRYNSVKITFADPQSAALTFGGLYRATDPEGFAEAVAAALPVSAERAGEVITLRSKPAPSMIGDAR